MKYKYNDVDIDSISYEDEVGDAVIYPRDSDHTHTISVITEQGECNVTYTLISDHDGAVIKVPFEECTHIEAERTLCRYQVECFESLTQVIDEARTFLEKYS